MTRHTRYLAPLLACSTFAATSVAMSQESAPAPLVIRANLGNQTS